MGFIRDSFGRVCVESRRESFILHVDHGGAPGPSPEFLTADLDDVIAALSDYRASLPAAGRAAATPDQPCPHGFGRYSKGGRVFCAHCDEPLPAPAASPDERLREALAWIAEYGERNGDLRTGHLQAVKHIARNALGLEPDLPLAAADREAPDEAGRICCRGMGADGGCNICAAEATR